MANIITQTAETNDNYTLNTRRDGKTNKHKLGRGNCTQTRVLKKSVEKKVKWTHTNGQMGYKSCSDSGGRIDKRHCNAHVTRSERS